jgi:hypothetical protein
VLVASELGSGDVRQVDAEDVRHPQEVDEDVGELVLDVLGARAVHDSPASSAVSHWKISTSSPTSPESAIARFFGVWNCSQSRSCANSRILA